MADRKVKLDSYGNGYAALIVGLSRFPREMWKFKPEGGWSIHEIVVHIADSEANSYIRCRRFLAEPGSELMAYDENRWAAELDYHEQSTDEALELFRLLRKRTFDLVRSAPEAVWSRTCFHPENGEMTMDDWLDTYERHIPDHVAQMDEVHRAWQAAGERADGVSSLGEAMTGNPKLSISAERPDTPEAMELIAELEAYLAPMYPVESRHGLSVEQLIEAKVAFFVLHCDGEPAGCGGVQLFGDEYGEVKRVYVRPQFRGQGLSKRIMEHLEAHAREHGIPVLRLETGILQQEAIGLYERLGYRKIGPFGEYRPDPLSIFYEKHLK